jgi:predicted AlkP superfamily phosphohydrolase/phosphomutase
VITTTITTTTTTTMGEFVTKRLRCGCEKKVFYRGTRRHIDGSKTLVGDTARWTTTCDKHIKAEQLKTKKARLKKAWRKVEEWQKVVEEYPAQIERLEEELKEPPDATVIYEQNIWEYAHGL